MRGRFLCEKMGEEVGGRHGNISNFGFGDWVMGIGAFGIIVGGKL